MPVIHYFDHLVASTYTIVNKIRLAQDASHVRPFSIWRSQFRKVGKQSCALDQIIAEAFSGSWIILRNKANNFFQLFERLRSEN